MLRRLSVITALVAAISAPPLAAQQTVHHIVIDGVIEMGLAPFVERAISEAEQAGAVAIVLDIETPGGRVDAAQRIAKAIVTTDVPTIALVNVHAWSAGALIALAADSIFMVPTSSIGAATPVDGAGQKTSEKIVSALRGEFRALAERRGIDPVIGEAMVDEDVELDGVVEAGKLLTLTAGEAVDIGVAQGQVDDLDELVTRLDASAQVYTPSLNWAERVVRFLSNPAFAPMLLSFGMLGIFLEFKTPTFGIAGTVGALCFAAFFGSHLLIGLAGWEEFILLGIGIVALALEVLVIPGFGIAGVVAILCITSAIFLSLIGSIPTWGDFARASSVVTGSLLLAAIGIGAMIRMLPQTSRMQSVILSASTDKELGYIAAPERKDLIGHVGVAATDLRPAGTAAIGSERVDVVTQGEFITKGTPVRVIESEAYRHIVEEADDIA